MKKKKKYFILLTAILYTAFIFYISLINLDDVSVPKFEGADKLEHMGAYAIEVILWCLFFLPTKKIAQILILLSIIFQGILIEFLQGTTTFRSFEVADMVANGFGCFLGLLAYKFMGQKYFEAKFSKL